MLPKHELHKLLGPTSLLEWAIRLHSEYIALSLWRMPELLNVFGSCHFDKFKFLPTSLTASNLSFQLIEIAFSEISPFYHHDYLTALLSSSSDFLGLNNSIPKVLECYEHNECAHLFSALKALHLCTYSLTSKQLTSFISYFLSLCLLFREYFHFKYYILCSHLFIQTQQISH